MELILLKIIKNIIKDFKLRLFAAFLFYGCVDVVEMNGRYIRMYWMEWEIHNTSAPTHFKGKTLSKLQSFSREFGNGTYVKNIFMI